VLLIALFFISGADAAAVVMSTMASKGSIAPSKVVTVIFGVLMGGIACAMLLVGGLAALQQAAILGSVPFTFVLIAVTWAWFKALREEDGTPVLEGGPLDVGTVDRPEETRVAVNEERSP
jgi:choline-glycine betaine transporter